MTTCACGADTTNKRVCTACMAAVTYIDVPRKPKPKPELESAIKSRIRAALIKEGALVWIHNVDNRLLHTGLGIGTGDIICVVPPHGRFLGIECKRPGRKPTADQERWLAVVRQFGGVGGVATNVEDAVALLLEARQSSPAHVLAPRA